MGNQRRSYSPGQMRAQFNFNSGQIQDWCITPQRQSILDTKYKLHFVNQGELQTHTFNVKNNTIIITNRYPTHTLIPTNRIVQEKN